MTIEQKIAELLAESQSVKDEVAEEVVAEETVTEDEISEETSAETTEEVVAEETEEVTFDINEDVAALIDGEDLTEEFKQKAATIFEAAVVTRVQAEVAKLEEGYEAKLQEATEQIKEGLSEKVDGYLDYVVEQWMEQNEIALERGMKSEILENFVSGLKGLFEEHYIDVPEEKFDVMEALETQIEDLTQKLDEQVEINVELNQEVAKHEVKEIIANLSEGLVDTDKEKFQALVEELEFDGVETFEKKAQTIRESYFTNKAKVAPTTEGSVVTDEPVALTEETVIADPVMRNYVSAIAKSIR